MFENKTFSSIFFLRVKMMDDGIYMIVQFVDFFSTTHINIYTIALQYYIDQVMIQYSIVSFVEIIGTMSLSGES